MIIDPNGNPLDYIDRLNDRHENLAIRLAVIGEWDASDPDVEEKKVEYVRTESALYSLARAIRGYQSLALTLTNEGIARKQ